MNGAVQNGQAFRDDVRALLRVRGFDPVQTQHRPVWATSYHVAETVDTWVGRIIIECRFQRVSGSADTKLFADLYNAAKSLDCADYIIVLGGQHWQTKRGEAIADAARTFAAEQSTEAKQLHVMTLWELREWLKSP